MKKKTLISASLILTITAAAAFSQNKPVTLSYKYPSQGVTYTSRSAIHEIMDVQGQSMDVYVNSSLRCLVKPDGDKLSITMDSLSQNIDSPQGAMGGPVDVKGKSFNLGLSLSGVVTDLSGAKKVTYGVAGSADSDLSTSFIDFFPRLPEKRIRPGDTWTSTDTVRSEAAINNMVTVVTSNNKFEGYEDLNGIRYAKITATTQGTSTMRNQVQGMDMKTSGNFTGNTSTWFAPDGYFVKFTENTKMTGTMEMTNEGYSFPITLDITKTTQAVK